MSREGSSISLYARLLSEPCMSQRTGRLDQSPGTPFVAGRGPRTTGRGPLRLSDSLAMELATELTADILGLGECPIILATDGEDHPLTALNLVWRRDA